MKMLLTDNADPKWKLKPIEVTFIAPVNYEKY